MGDRFVDIEEATGSNPVQPIAKSPSIKLEGDFLYIESVDKRYINMECSKCWSCFNKSHIEDKFIQFHHSYFSLSSSTDRLK